MKLLKVPHYKQDGRSDCQAACAAMVLDYWAGREDGENAERIGELLDRFSAGFRPESGKCPPAITGLVAMELARSGLAVDFYSRKPDGGGVEGLGFLKTGWDFSEGDVENYARHAGAILSEAEETGLTIHHQPIHEKDIVAAIAAEKPVVVIVDLEVLKDWAKSANHAVVVTGIDDETVAIHDPADGESHRRFDRQKFFDAHFQTSTDCDAYVVEN